MSGETPPKLAMEWLDKILTRVKTVEAENARLQDFIAHRPSGTKPQREAQMLKRMEAAEGTVDLLRDALWQIKTWSEAYPLDIFPEPDLKRAHKVLQEHGMGIDAISAHVARHVVEGVGKIARDALEAK